MDDRAMLDMMMQAEATAARASKDTPLAPVTTTATTPMDRAWGRLVARMNAAATQMDARARRTAQAWQNRIFDGAGIEPHDAGMGD